jgi:hypothetical protein
MMKRTILFIAAVAFIAGNVTAQDNSSDLRDKIQIGFISLLAGPQFSFLLKQKDVLGNSSLTQDFNNDNIRKNTLGFLGGADINLSNLVLGVRAGWDLQDNNGDGTSDNPRYKNVWYQATIGFRF